jgi:hypothetical protein
VCPITETAAPRRMGAALTYARRYALFTLVGIAGEDDLDAPDLGAGGNSDKNPGLDIQTSPKPVADELPFAPSGASRKGKVIRSPRIVLATDESEALRDRLVAELSDLKSTDDAADWVHKNLPPRPPDRGPKSPSFWHRPRRERRGCARSASMPVARTTRGPPTSTLPSATGWRL